MYVCMYCVDGLMDWIGCMYVCIVWMDGCIGLDVCECVYMSE